MSSFQMQIFLLKSKLIVAFINILRKNNVAMYFANHSHKGAFSFIKVNMAHVMINKRIICIAICPIYWYFGDKVFPV